MHACVHVCKQKLRLIKADDDVKKLLRLTCVLSVALLSSSSSSHPPLHSPKTTVARKYKYIHLKKPYGNALTLCKNVKI